MALLDGIFNDFLALGIVLAFFLVIYAKMKSQTIGDVIRDIKEATNGE